MNSLTGGNDQPSVQHSTRKPPREKALAALCGRKTDIEIAKELGDTENRVAAQRQRLAEKFQIDTYERLVEVANTLGRYARRRNSQLLNGITRCRTSELGP